MKSIQTVSAIDAVAALDLGPIKTKLMHTASGEGWSAARADAVEVEYRRFLTLMKLYPNDVTAPVVDIDTFWHYHILDTAKYAADCDQAFGYFLHHYPYLGMDGDDGEAMLEAAGVRMQELYAATFGTGVAAAPAAWCGAATQAPQQAAWCGAATAVAWCGAAQQATAWCGAATQAAAKQSQAWCGAATSTPVKQTLAWCGAATSTPVKQTLAWCGAATTAPAKQSLAWCGAATSAPVKQTRAWCGAAQPTHLQVSEDVAITVMQG